MTQSIALITGGADGIGWATAQKFAEMGYVVAIADINLERAKERAKTLGSQHIALQVDVANEVAILSCVDALKAQLGRCDVLINCAGIPDVMGPSLDQSMDDFKRIMDINLNGTFMMTRTVARLMIEQGGGAVVNLSSIAGLGGLPRRNAYGAAKAGIVALTRSLGCEWAGAGVRVNAIAPGYVKTPLIEKLAASGRVDLEKIKRRVPMGKLADPDDIAEAIYFLASPGARYITGTVLSVDGGWTAFADFGDAS